ncbi:ABC transporter permease [Emticicia sp. BO119]|uniref:ABC transporter permease n=1 Tax=Emticicia sp. BO119 TaxID=2757768 RepID=UPI0015F047BB|nr:ABC transporter permease [Emticicia sp. BO119]MBA4851984.1 ABC transporter permease [Emticicia sp. BO119]
MKYQIRAFQAEIIKNRNSNMLWGTFIAFGIAPVIGGVFILIIQDTDALAKAGSLALKANAMNFEANWKSYMGLLTQAVAVGGVLVFGFVASWIFGREYSEGTAKDLLSLPTSRTKILNAKFVVYVLWCLALVLSNLLIGFLIAAILRLPLTDVRGIFLLLNDYFITAFMTIIVGFPIALFAIWGKGYLAPLAFVALTLVFSQIIAATGYGTYFPWSIPGLFSGAGGEYKKLLNNYSYSILILTGTMGYFATIAYWRKADQTK